MLTDHTPSAGRLWQSGDKPCFCEFYRDLEKSSLYIVNHCPEDSESFCKIASIHDAYSNRPRCTARQVLWRPHPLPMPLRKILVLPDPEAIARVLDEQEVDGPG